LQPTFRRLLEEYNLTRGIFDEINAHLSRDNLADSSARM
jgi:hypothetical protein